MSGPLQLVGEALRELEVLEENSIGAFQSSNTSAVLHVGSVGRPRYFILNTSRLLSTPDSLSPKLLIFLLCLLEQCAEGFLSMVSQFWLAILSSSLRGLMRFSHSAQISSLWLPANDGASEGSRVECPAEPCQGKSTEG